MRKFKFRAWDTQLKKFFDLKNAMVIGLDGNIVLMTNQGPYPYPVAGGHERFVLQQFTGLIDKNSKEVFEGDTVRTDPNHPSLLMGAAAYTEGEIVFYSGGFHICQKEVGGEEVAKYQLCDCCPCGLEVIGHIFDGKEYKEV